MKALIACERFGIVRAAFCARGHDAWSCDLVPAADGGPHIIGDVLQVLNRGWDLLIAHPPCTYLCSSGLHWNKRRPEREWQTERALEFVEALLHAPVKKRVLENPIGCISTRIRKPEQIIQPWQFGHAESKATCLWLAGVPPLKPTARLFRRWLCKCGARWEQGQEIARCPECRAKDVKLRWENQTFSGQNKLAPSATRAMDRAKTYQGIADAMASQWGAAA